MKLSAAKLKAFGAQLIEICTRRFFLKVLSLVMALVLWTYIVSNTPTLTRSKYVTSISLSNNASNPLSAYSLALLTDIYSQYKGAISAEVEVAQSKYSNLTANAVRVTADLSGIRAPGEYEVPLSATCSYGTVTKLYPETISVVVENLDARTLEIELVTDGADTDMYLYQVDSVNPKEITVSGPASLVQNVNSIIAVSDVSGRATGFRRYCALTLTDANGETLTSRQLTKSSSSCTAKIDIYPKKVLEVRVDNSQIPVKEGYHIESVTYQPATITVAADSELLAQLEYLPLEVPENFAELTKTNTKRLEVKTLDDIQYISAKQVYITINIAEDEQ